MSLSAAEKQRRYQACRDGDPERRARCLEWENKKWRREKEQGKKNKTPRVPQERAEVTEKKMESSPGKEKGSKKGSITCNHQSTPPVSPESQQSDSQEAGPSRIELVKHI